MHWRIDATEREFAVYPLFRRRVSVVEDRREVDVLWPLVRWRHRQRTPAKTDEKLFSIMPLYGSQHAKREEQPYFHRFLLPIYFEGQGTEGGRYFILAPFLWYARDARMAVPMFPRRPQTFTAVWPLAGEFHGYFNRDLIRFRLWPLYVYSAEGEGPDRVELISVPWPFIGWYRGETISGFRLWPLASYVRRPGEFRRGYWLWPLGHYRKEMGTETEPPSELTLFIPFYGRLRSEKLSYDLLFPFYGRLEAPGRRVRGYALAIYNEDDNLRRGIRQHRILWFIGRWTSRIPIDEQFAREPGDERPEPMQGGGVFPIFIKRTDETRLRQTVLWPIYHRRIDRHPDYTRSRAYLLPFYGRHTREYTNGPSDAAGFLFPFYRYARTRQGRLYRSAPHLFPYSEAEPMDRNWAPLWSVWTEERDAASGEVRARVLGPVWQYDRDAAGGVRRRLDAGVLRVERRGGGREPAGTSLDLLFGLAGVDRTAGRTTWKLLGKEW